VRKVFPFTTSLSHLLLLLCDSLYHAAVCERGAAAHTAQGEGQRATAVQRLLLASPLRAFPSGPTLNLTAALELVPPLNDLVRLRLDPKLNTDKAYQFLGACFSTSDSVLLLASLQLLHCLETPGVSCTASAYQGLL